MTPEDKQRLIAEFVKNQSAPMDPGSGRLTALLCSCGGPLQMQSWLRKDLLEGLLKEQFGPPPKHRKKWTKRYQAKCRPLVLAHLVMSAAMKPSYVCTKCRSRQSFYGAIARNLFKVEPLPPGAIAIYDKDPSVAEIVTEAS